MATKYQNPRFGLLHLARDRGGVASLSGAPALPSDIERWLDDRTSLPTGDYLALATGQINQDQEGSFREPVSRLWIPPSAFATAGDREYSWFKGEAAAADGGLHFTGDGTLASVIPAPGMPVDLDLEEALDIGQQPTGTTSRDRFQTVLVLSGDVDAFRPGEIVWTRMLQPRRGVDPKWSDNSEENALIQDTEASQSFRKERGPSRRRWRLTWPRATGDSGDLAILDSVISHGSKHAFLFDPPDWGTREILIDPLSAVNPGYGSNPAETSVTIIAGGAPDGIAGATEIANLTAVDAALNISDSATGLFFDDSPTPLPDLSDYYLGVDVWIESDASWVIADNLQVAISSNTVAAAGAEFTFWYLGRPIEASPLIDHWYRIWIDPATLVASNGTRADLTAVSFIGLNLGDGTIGRTARFANLRLRKKDAGPFWVELLGHQRVVDTPVPRGPDGPTWEIQLDLREVLS